MSVVMGWIEVVVRGFVYRCEIEALMRCLYSIICDCMHLTNRLDDGE